MEPISRRQFLSLLPVPIVSVVPCSPAFALSGEKNNIKQGEDFPITIRVLYDAYVLEMIAHEHYNRYVLRAVRDKRQNIAYLFKALSLSEKIHAENYKTLLGSFGSRIQEEPVVDVSVSNTVTNLSTAVEKERIMIQKTYPGLISKLENESVNDAVISCMHSWKVHQQHKRKIARMQRYFKISSSVVARRIEKLRLEFHVCEICGSTLSRPPQSPCTICHHPMSYYRKVTRPRLT